jgi:hypothetical protein
LVCLLTIDVRCLGRVIAFLAAEVILDATEPDIAFGCILVFIAAGIHLEIIGNILP